MLLKYMLYEGCPESLPFIYCRVPNHYISTYLDSIKNDFHKMYIINVKKIRYNYLH